MCGAQTLRGITATVGNNTNARSLQIGRFVQREEWAWIGNPSLQKPLSHFVQRGRFSVFSTPIFSFSTSPFPKAGLRFGENYAHCLIPDMDRSGQRVWRQIISSAAKHSWPQWKTQHIKTHFRQGRRRVNKCFKPWMINTILHLTGFGRGKKTHVVSCHDCISMQDAVNSCTESWAYLNKTAAFLISCLWNFVQKKKCGAINIFSLWN